MLIGTNDGYHCLGALKRSRLVFLRQVAFGYLIDLAEGFEEFLGKHLLGDCFL